MKLTIAALILPALALFGCSTSHRPAPTATSTQTSTATATSTQTSTATATATATSTATSTSTTVPAATSTPPPPLRGPGEQCIKVNPSGVPQGIPCPVTADPTPPPSVTGQPITRRADGSCWSTYIHAGSRVDLRVDCSTGEEYQVPTPTPVGCRTNPLNGLLICDEGTD